MYIDVSQAEYNGFTFRNTGLDVIQVNLSSGICSWSFLNIPQAETYYLARIDNKVISSSTSIKEQYGAYYIQFDNQIFSDDEIQYIYSNAGSETI